VVPEVEAGEVIASSGDGQWAHRAVHHGVSGVHVVLLLVE
jgi:hypothetical protein